MDICFFQKGFNYSQDGPGNRLIYHLQGCNLRCPWCSNPEGLSPSGGQISTVETLLDEALRCRPLFFDGGGVTLTGGEVAMQMDAVKAFLGSLRTAGINTAIETNGTSARLPELFPVSDHLIMDCKHYNRKVHRAVTGGDCAAVFSNMQKAVSYKVPLAIRIPLVGGFNATANDAERFCDLFDTLEVREHATLELLRYHEFGKEKYQKLGLPYRMTSDAFVGDEEYRAITQVFRRRGYVPIRT